jgi:hypothetical protein
MELWDMAPALVKPEVEDEEDEDDDTSDDYSVEPKPPVRGPNLTIDGDGGTWELPASMKRSDDLRLVLGRGDIDAATLFTIELQFDQPLDESIEDLNPEDLVELKDLGFTDDKRTDGRIMPVELSLAARDSRLVIRPMVKFSPGHSYTLELIDPGQIKAKVGGKSYWSEDITKFEFATHKVGGKVVGRTDQGQVNLHPDAWDQLKMGNLLMVAEGYGHLRAIDVTDYNNDYGFKVHATMIGSGKPIRSLATDGHNRLFMSTQLGATWALKTVRIEDVRTPDPDRYFSPVWGGIKLGYGGWYYSATTASEYLSAGAFPSGTPLDLKVVVQDEMLEPPEGIDLEEFYEKYSMEGADEFSELKPDEEGFYAVEVELKSSLERKTIGEDFRTEHCESDEPWDRYQRTTVDNLTTGQSWSFDIANKWKDAGGSGKYTLTVRARREDRLRVRYNLHTLGYVAMMGSGILVTDLNRGYRHVPEYTPAERRRQCGELLGVFEGEHMSWPPEAERNGVPPDGLEWTSAVTAHTWTGFEDDKKNPLRGKGDINVYSPLRYVGLVHTRSPDTQPGNLNAESALVIKEVWPERKHKKPDGTTENKPTWYRVRTEDVALANNVKWIDHGLRGSVVWEEIEHNEEEITINNFRFIDENGSDKPKEKIGDLLFASLGMGGVAVFDVSDRSLNKLIGHLFYKDHVVHRVQVDDARGLLYAGGYDPKKGWMVDVWDIRAVNSQPDPEGDPEPLQSIYGFPWKTRNLGVDTGGLNMLYTWTSWGSAVAVPQDKVKFHMRGLYLPEEEETQTAKEDPPEEPPEDQRRPSVEKLTEQFVPLGIPLETTPEKEEDNQDENERKATAAFKVRVTLPGSFGPELTAKVQTLRMLPDERYLGQEDVGAAVALPGGPGWPDRDVVVTLRRVGVDEDDDNVTDERIYGEDGKFGPAYNLYESKETVLMVADPRARRKYHPQKLPDDSEYEDADEESQCRRCGYPSYLPDPKKDPSNEELKDIKELLAGGPYVRIFLYAEDDPPDYDPDDPDNEDDPAAAARANTREVIDFFKKYKETYPLPFGVARLVAWADALPSPVQVTGEEPALSPAYWSPDEAGVSVALTSGDAVLKVVDVASEGRRQVIAVDRNYRSGTLAYGPFGSGGWHSTLFAHLREIQTTGEVEYHDGTGQVFRFLPREDDDVDAPDGYDFDKLGSYHVPEGLFLRLQRLPAGAGWRMIDRHHNTMIFDAQGRISEASDRLRRGNTDIEWQGNSLVYHYDLFGQLISVEDEWGRTYSFEYYDDPINKNEEERKRYGLLKKVEHFVDDRTIEYRYDDDRLMEKVRLPEVANPTDAYSGFSYTGEDRPTLKYRYEEGVDTNEESTTAILHGKFSQLRLAGFELPDFGHAGTERLQLKYYSDSGKVERVLFPGSDGNQAEWTLEYGETDAGPNTQALITAPWGLLTEYKIESGRTTEIKQYGVETLGRDDDGQSGEIPGGKSTEATSKDLVTTFTYVDVVCDGRLRKVVLPEKSVTNYAYIDDDENSNVLDFLKKQNLKAVIHGVESEGEGEAKDEGSTYAEYFLEYDVDNFPVKVKDSYEQVVQTRAATPDESGIQIGHPDENVMAERDDDKYGRVESINFAAGSIAKSDIPVKPLAVSYDYHDRDNKNGTGSIKQITYGEGDEAVWEKYEYYPETDNLHYRESSFGTRDTFGYDDWDRQVEVTSGESCGGDYLDVSAQIQRAFDAAGHLIRERFKQKDVGWVETRFEYNAREQIVKVTKTHLASRDVGGSFVEGLTEYTYRSDGILDKVTSPEGIVTDYELDSAGRVATVQVGEPGPSGPTGIQKRLYDELGRLVYTTDGHEGSWRGKYDHLGNRFQERLPSGVLIERELSHKVPIGQFVRETVYSDDSKSKRLHETRTHIGGLGKVEYVEKAIIDADGNESVLTTDYQYDSNGKVQRVTSCEANSPDIRIESEVGYDAAGRLVYSRDAAGNEVEYEYRHQSPWPDAITYRDAIPSGPTNLDRTTEFVQRDALGRVLLESNDGTITERGFDEVGNLLFIKNKNNVVKYTYDGRGLKRSVFRQATLQEVKYGYDSDGNMLKTEVGRHTGDPDITTYGYDSTGRLHGRTRPGSIPEMFYYYPDGVLREWHTRYEEGARLILNYEYDEANRLKGRKVNADAFDPDDLPAGLAPLDDGDVYTFDELSRPLSVAFKTGTSEDSDTKVAYSRYDSRGLPEEEYVGTRPVLKRSYDIRGNAISAMLPQGIGGDSTVPGFAYHYDSLDRPDQVAAATADGFINTGSPFRSEFTWGGIARLYGVTSYGPLGVKHVYRHEEIGLRLSGLEISAGGRQLGAFTYTWDRERNLLEERSVANATPPALNLTTSMGWSWTHDEADRLWFADSNQGLDRTPEGGEHGLSWEYGHGKADELLSIFSTTKGKHEFDSGVEGRIESRRLGDEVLESFEYDDESRRIEDDRNHYLYTWRGDMVQVDVKEDAPQHAGERVVYSYDASGRLLERTHFSKIPEGGGEGDRSFIEGRQFVWIGANLAAEVGLNFEGQIIWRKQYLAGPSGFSGAPQMRVQTNLNGGGSTDKYYAFLRDEAGNVIGVLEDSQPEQGKPPKLLARYLYTPFGESHIELGPELTSIRFDAGVTEVEGQPQAPPIEEETVGGALRVVTSMPLDPQTYLSGISLEIKDTDLNSWSPESRDAYVIGRDAEDPSQLLIMRKDGWVAAEHYRIRLLPHLRDEFDRQIQLPSFELTGIEVELEVPDKAEGPPVYNRVFGIEHDSVRAAGTTFDGAIPGGQTSLFKGQWTDPVTGISYANNIWYDSRLGTLLCTDSVFTVDPYAYAISASGPSISGWKIQRPLISKRRLERKVRLEKKVDYDYNPDDPGKVFMTFTMAFGKKTEEIDKTEEDFVEEGIPEHAVSDALYVESTNISYWAGETEQAWMDSSNPWWARALCFIAAPFMRITGALDDYVVNPIVNTPHRVARFAEIGGTKIGTAIAEGDGWGVVEGSGYLMLSVAEALEVVTMFKGPPGPAPAPRRGVQPAVHPGKLAAESSELSRASVMRALRQAETPEAHATAKLLKRGKVTLEILEKIPAGLKIHPQAAAYYSPGGKVLTIIKSKMSSARSAAGYTGHEFRHWLQWRSGIRGGSKLSELEAYLWQRAIDPSIPGRADLIKFINTHPAYKNLPALGRR